MLCRDLQKAKLAAEEIHQETGNALVVYHLDLASLQSIRDTAATLKDVEPKIHILINNAGESMAVVVYLYSISQYNIKKPHSWNLNYI